MLVKDKKTQNFKKILSRDSAYAHLIRNFRILLGIRSIITFLKTLLH